jgi:2-dehydropantoate 2-reductase
VYEGILLVRAEAGLFYANTPEVNDRLVAAIELNATPVDIFGFDLGSTPTVDLGAEVLSAVTPVVMTDNRDGYLWGKLGYAVLGFVVSSVDMPIDEVIMVPEAQEVIRAAVAEVVDVAHKQGIRLENIHGFEPNLFDRSNPNRVEETNEMFRRWADESRISIKRHMGIHRDIRFRKRRTEVDFQVGAVVERGRELGVPTPVLESLVDLIHEVETGERAQDWFTIHHLHAGLSMKGSESTHAE